MKYKAKTLLSYLFCFFAGSAFGAFAFQLTNNQSNSLELSSKNSTATSLRLIWEKDLAQLKEKNQLPKQWGEIRQIQYRALSKMSSQWINATNIPISVNAEGKYLLNLELDHWLEGQKVAAIVHYQIVDSKSGNTVWEFGRTYPLK